MSAVKNLKDPQSELLLLLNCSGISKLYFVRRTTKPSLAIIVFDTHLLQYLRQLIIEDGAGFGPVQQRIAALPIQDGGLGIYTMANTSIYCYIASQSQLGLYNGLFSTTLILHVMARVIHTNNLYKPSLKYMDYLLLTALTTVPLSLCTLWQ